MVLVSLVQLCPCPEATSTPCMGCNCGTYLPAPLLPLPPAAARGGGALILSPWGVWGTAQPHCPLICEASERPAQPDRQRGRGGFTAPKGLCRGT